MAIPPTIFQRTAPVEQGAISITPLGSLTIAASAEFASVGSLVQSGILGNIADVQSVWCDASAATDPVYIRNAQTRQYVVFPPGTSGWQNLLLKKDANQFEVSCVSGATIALAVTSAVLAAVVSDAGLIQSSPTSRRVDVAAAIVSTTLLAEQPQRQGFSIWNEGAATLYVLLEGSTGASSVNYTVQLNPGSNYFESPFRYGGKVSGIWSAAVGGARITEYL